ncbi:hypothetical protein MWN41_08130 [Ornithobacterium rhinotracheale]|uniref:hypothetical protein n=1 Tax=Ornithobacterium rhinotracheale TaxID=28251 RepID=UPI001FF4CD44|nr:hypothetical protein [Ornithobacterium rhinotracheale]MCK0202980.1 hypothetical protein [Ornithobacterium rhinotracheale]
MTLAINTELLFKPKNGRAFSVFRVSEIEIESSWKMLTDTAKIVLPRNVRDFDKYKVGNVFKAGDKCVIKMGYNGELLTEFTGYIRKVSADYPITIELEDEMFRLKKIPVHYSGKSGSLKNFLNAIVKGIEIDCEADIQIGAMRFANTTLGAVLDTLQKDYSLYAFIRNGKLTIAKPYSDVKNDKLIYRFDLERNCVSNDLKYLSKEDRTIKIKATSVTGKGKKLEYEFGDENPKTTLNIKLDFGDKSAMEKEVKRLYDLHKREGFEGTFTTLGMPSLQHGEKVSISSTLYSDRKGIYYIERVVKKLSADGYRQEIEIGQVAKK